jgi:ribose transport system substrate-binding protein
MRKVRRSLIVLLIAGLAMTALVSCSNNETQAAAPAAEAAPAAAAPTLKIGMAFQEMDNLYFVVMKEALIEACESIGAEAVVTDARHDVSKQISDIEDMIQKGIDVLLINPTDSVGVQGAVESAKAAGVVVVAVDAQAAGPIDSFVGSKNYDAGVYAGEFLAKERLFDVSCGSG